MASSGEFLPSARSVSLSVHGDHDAPHKHMTAMAAIFGEFLFHDLSHTPQMAGEFFIEIHNFYVFLPEYKIIQSVISFLIVQTVNLMFTCFLFIIFYRFPYRLHWSTIKMLWSQFQ